MNEELAKHIEAIEPPLMPEFLSWWNSTHDFDFVKDGGLYEKHALRCWMAGRSAAALAKPELMLSSSITITQAMVYDLG